MSADERPIDGSSSRRAPDEAADRAPAGAVLARHDVIELRIEQLVSGGDGLGRFEGIPIFVPRSAPGDLLEVRLTQRRPGYGRGELVEIIESGPGRREPPCAWFSRCGGCDLQHLEDRLQAELKAAAALETFRRLGRLELPDDVPVITGAAWGYRLRTQLHVAADAEGTRVGYFERGTHKLVAIGGCPVCRPELESVISGLGAVLADSPPPRVDLAVGDEDRVVSAPVVPGLAHGEVSIEAAGLTFAFDARCFFQGHYGLIGTLIETVVGEWSGDSAVDLYGGVGLFGIACAANYDQVTIVESDRVPARYARINARRNRLANLVVESKAVESWIGSLDQSVDRLIVDPPRAGLSKRVRYMVLERLPRRITYVSCHPASMARDLRQFGTAYTIDSMTLIDLFPQTGHIEAVAQLSLRDGA